MIDNAQLKQACLEFLASKNANSFSYSQFINGIAINLLSKNDDLLIKHQFLIDKPNHKIKNINNDFLTDKDLFNLELFTENIIEELLWHFINSGIITIRFHNFRLNPTSGDLNVFDYFHVTQWGLNVLKDIKPSPYDYEEFLRDLSKLINEETTFYLIQSLECFRRNLFVPSAIMLGIAAENIILEISEIAEKKVIAKDKYQKTLKDNRFQVTGHKKAIDEFVISKMPKDKKKYLKKDFNCFFEIIRLSRNEAGHPSEVRIERDEAYANYLVFRRFGKNVYELKQWLEHQTSI